jgi:hypothetical protein
MLGRLVQKGPRHGSVGWSSAGAAPLVARHVLRESVALGPIGVSAATVAGLAGRQCGPNASYFPSLVVPGKRGAPPGQPATGSR